MKVIQAGACTGLGLGMSRDESGQDEVDAEKYGERFSHRVPAIGANDFLSFPIAGYYFSSFISLTSASTISSSAEESC